MSFEFELVSNMAEKDDEELGRSPGASFSIISPGLADRIKRSHPPLNAGHPGVPWPKPTPPVDLTPAEKRAKYKNSVRRTFPVLKKRWAPTTGGVIGPGDEFADVDKFMQHCSTAMIDGSRKLCERKQ